MVRTGLLQILSADPALSVVAQAATGVEAVAGCSAYRPDIVLMDIRMPEMDGVEATLRLANSVAAPRVVALTSFDSGENVMRMLEAGAVGFIAKDIAPDQLIAALYTVMSGDSFISPSSTKHLIGMIGRGAVGTQRHAAQLSFATLSERERDVARMVWEGAGNAQIAAELFVGETTVKSHLKSIFSKLAVDNRVQLAIVVERAQAGL